MRRCFEICVLTSRTEAQGIIEYLKVSLNDKSGVLTSAIWSYQRSSETVARCGDVLYWDSTRNTTKYSYKLSTFTVVDSECSSRAVLFCLTLRETAEECKAMLVAWHLAFNSRLPKVIFSDGDEAIHVAIFSVPYASEIKHLICIFHLFDMNAKERGQPVLTSLSGVSTWPGFRKSLSTCREASTAEELRSLWRAMLNEWLPKSPKTEEVRKYLERYIWSKRKQWAVAFFRHEFTLGSSTTQRSESWNSIVKAFSTSDSLQSLARSLPVLVERQSASELKSVDSSLRWMPLKKSGAELWLPVMEAITSQHISSFACSEIAEELMAANRMSVEIISMATEESVLTGIARYTYGNDGLEVSSTKVSVSFYLSDRHEKSLSVVSCECLYSFRMKLPCRHSIALCSTADSEKHKKLQCNLEKNGFSSALNCLIIQSTGKRWSLPFTGAEDTDRDLIARKRNQASLGFLESGIQNDGERDISEWLYMDDESTSSI